MRSKKFNKKLSLKKNTVSNLNVRKMAQAKGGGVAPSIATDCVYSCYYTKCVQTCYEYTCEIGCTQSLCMTECNSDPCC